MIPMVMIGLTMTMAMLLMVHDEDAHDGDNC